MNHTEDHYFNVEPVNFTKKHSQALSSKMKRKPLSRDAWRRVQGVYCLLRFVGFVWGHVQVICKAGSCWNRFRGSCSKLVYQLSNVSRVGSLCCKWRIQQSPGRSCVLLVDGVQQCGSWYQRSWSLAFFQVSASLAVSTFDSVHCSLSGVRSVFVRLTSISKCRKVVIGLWTTWMSDQAVRSVL